MTFSYYYADPDGNHVELQVDNFGDWAEVDRVDADLARSSRPTRSASSSIPSEVAADHADGVDVRGDPRQGDGRRLRARAGAGRDPGAHHEALQVRGSTARGRQRGRRRTMRSSTANRGDRHPLEEVRAAGSGRGRGSSSAIGLNYADHIAESGMEAPEFPVFFNKQSTCVVGPGDDVHMPRVSSLLDYEGELAIVIGERCRHVAEERAAGGDRRLHDRQRRLGARLAAAHADDDDRQVVRHPRPARALDRHRRRARRSARARRSGPASTTSCARTATPAR